MARWTHPRSVQAFGLLIHDVVALYLAIRVAHQLYYGYWGAAFEAAMVALIGLTVFCIFLFDVYRVDVHDSSTRVVLRMFYAVVLSGGTIAALAYITKTDVGVSVLWRANLALSLGIFTFWATSIRVILRIATRRISRERKWLVLGDSDISRALVRDNAAFPGTGAVEIVNLDDADEISITRENRRVNISRDEKAENYESVEGIVLVSDSDLPRKVLANLMHIRLSGLPVLPVSEFYEQYLLRIPVLQLGDGWFVFSEGFSLVHHEVALKIKRVADIVLSAIGLILTVPLMALVAIAVKAGSPGPALYHQGRTGHGGRQFNLHKFRTMIDNAEIEGAKWAEHDDPRITTVGRFLRKLRLDELPQLWNVLVGEMSFIGPRPERPDFIERLESEIPYYDLRHLVNPGITGWAQVMYPYGSSVDDARRKLEFDLFYIKNYSIAMDISILFRTARVVFSRSGV